MIIVAANGDKFIVNMPYTNKSLSLDALNAVLTITVPPGLIISSANVPVGTFAVSAWSLGTVAPNTTRIAVIEFEVTNIALVPYAISWVASASNSDSNPADNTVSIVVTNTVCPEPGEQLTVMPVNDVNQCVCHFVGTNDILCPTGTTSLFEIVGTFVNSTATMDLYTGEVHVIPIDPTIPWSYQYQLRCRDCATGVVSGPYGPATVSGPAIFTGPIASYAALGDFVWHDLNGNGIQDLGEPGIPGVTVTLINVDTAATTTTTTDANGRYMFINLLAGDYAVNFTTPATYTPTLPNVGSDLLDSDSVLGTTGTYSLLAGQTETSVDAGFYIPASLGGFVWFDQNANGIQNGGGETGFPGLPVNLINVTTAQVTPTATDANGRYLFTGLAPGPYRVAFTAPPGNLYETIPNIGADNLDSDNVAGLTGIYTLVSGQFENTVDAGYGPPASLGGFVWHDQNGNGVQNVGEPGFPGLPVTLINVITLATTPGVTDANGRYLFPNLAPGQYQVAFTAPVGSFLETIPNLGADNLDSDNVAGLSGIYTLVTGQFENTVDAGYGCNLVFTLAPIVTPCGTPPFPVINLRLLEPVGYTLGIWRRLNNSIVGSPTTVPRTVTNTYTYTYTGLNGCTVIGSQAVSRGPLPDYTPNITIFPTTTVGISPVNVLIDVTELLNVANCREIFVTIPTFEGRYSFTWVPNMTLLPDPTPGPSNSVSNVDWLYLGIDISLLFHRWQYIGNAGAFPPATTSSFGFEGIYDPQGTNGITVFTVEIIQGAGGENVFNNNADGTPLSYS